MAKKKNAVKSGLNQLRQALLDVKTAIIHFSDDHIISIGYDPSSKATVVTDIPQNLSSQFTLGEGGGGFTPKYYKFKTYSAAAITSKTNIPGLFLTDKGTGDEPTYSITYFSFSSGGQLTLYYGSGYTLNTGSLTQVISSDGTTINPDTVGKWVLKSVCEPSEEIQALYDFFLEEIVI